MIKGSMKKGLLLFVAALLCMNLFGISPAQAVSNNNEEFGKLVVSVLVEGVWVEQGSLAYGKFISEKSLKVTGTQADEPTLIKLQQQGGGKAHLDSVVLGTYSPVEVNGDIDAYVRKLASMDQDLINVEASGVVLKFTGGDSDNILKIAARVEPEVISKTPFHYPTSNLYKEFNLDSEYYTYQLDSSRGSLAMDGSLNEIASRAPFFTQYTIPDSGHPEGITYGWVWNDDENLYVVIDFTSDNTFDNDADYTKVYVKTNTGVKEFKVSVLETTWGQQFFTYTDKVSYEHKVYEYRIPLTNLEMKENQKELQLGFSAYGTAAPGPATDNDNTYIGVDGRDISIQWLPRFPQGLTATVDIYLLPNTSLLDIGVHHPIAESVIQTGYPSSWTGTSSETMDSAGNQLTAGIYQYYIYNNSLSDLTDPGVADPTIILRSDVDASKFTAVDNYTGTQDKLQSAENATGGENLEISAYLWKDSNTDGIVDLPDELGPAISLGTSHTDGSVDAADIGDLPAGTYKFVITATSNGIESIKDGAHAVKVTLTNEEEPLSLTLNSITSNNPNVGVAKAGDTVTVMFTSNKELDSSSFAYIGEFQTKLPVTKVSGNMYSAEHILPNTYDEGEVSTYIVGRVSGSNESNYVLTTKDSSGHSVNFDKTAPEGTLSINRDELTTDATSVTLTVTGTDPDGTGAIMETKADIQPKRQTYNDNSIVTALATSISMSLASLPPKVPGSGNVEMSFSNDMIDWSTWEPIATTKVWKLLAGNGTKTVYMKLKDAAGNETTEAITASITLKKTSSGGETPTPPEEMITVNVENGADWKGTVVSTALINRTTDTDGRKKEEVTFPLDLVNKAVDELTAAGSDVARIVIPDLQDEVAELTVNFPRASTERLVNGNVGMEIFTNNMRIDIPKSSLEGIQEDIYFRIVPIKNEDQRKEIEQRAQTGQAVRDIAGNDILGVIGRPVTLTTNLQSNAVTLILPLRDTSLTEQQLKNLGVYIEYNDGTKGLVKGEVVSYDGSGKYGISVTLSKLGTMAIVNIQASEVEQHKAYISGYPDGTFGPERSITRAEMAALLARVSKLAMNEVNVSYSDVASSNWANKAIEAVSRMGLMVGYTDRSFRPDQVITHAEMVVILSRWLGNDQSNGDTNDTFRPEQMLTRAEAVNMINNLLGRGALTTATATWSDVPSTHWAFEQIQEASIDHEHKDATE